MNYSYRTPLVREIFLLTLAAVLGGCRKPPPTRPGDRNRERDRLSGFVSPIEKTLEPIQPIADPIPLRYLLVIL
jgi:hypothetical protein